ncbi:hypothetical protein Slin14017_G086810 [Septoria linicola]|nr:hypothetical protein Slin14017_G086810 [Septoria linicola]
MPHFRQEDLSNLCDFWKFVDPSSTSPENMSAYLDKKLVDLGPKVNRTPLRILQAISLHERALQVLPKNDLHLRLQQGLPLYETWKTSEIERCCLSRTKMSLTGPSSMRRLNALAILNEADANRAFACFEKLPREIRLIIYEYHFAHLCEPTKVHGPLWAATLKDRIETNEFPQPPLTKVSRNGREEALDLWYRTLETTIVMCCDDLHHEYAPMAPLVNGAVYRPFSLIWRIREKTMHLTQSVHFDTEIFLRSIRLNSISSALRKVRIVGLLQIDFIGYFEGEFDSVAIPWEYTICLSSKRQVSASSRAISSVPAEQRWASRLLQMNVIILANTTVQEVVDDALDDYTKRIAHPEHGLQLDDVDALLNLFRIWIVVQDEFVEDF